MKLHRFYVGDHDAKSEFLLINDPLLSRQWGNVLRFRVGDEVALFDAAENESLYRFTRIARGVAELQRVAARDAHRPTRVVTIAFALLKKDKTEWVLQKGTELGVSRFIPLFTERTEKTGWSSDRAQKIIIEAAEQCGRSDIPKVHAPIAPADILSSLSGGALFYCDEGGVPVGKRLHGGEPATLFVGPEGGWTDSERALFAKHNAVRVSLGEFTLRAETAGLTAAALCA